MAKVFAPNREYSGMSAGVTFVAGQAETDDARLLEWFRENGYSVEAVPPTQEPPALEWGADGTKTAGMVHEAGGEWRKPTEAETALRARKQVKQDK